MSKLALFLVLVVVLIHFGIAAVEMFAWKFPQVHERLGYTSAEAEKVAPIVANAGLYNAFIAAGLVWGLLAGVGSGSYRIQAFFLCCVIIAGVFGAITLKPTTLVLQTIPGALALAAVWAAHRSG